MNYSLPNDITNHLNNLSALSTHKFAELAKLLDQRAIAQGQTISILLIPIIVPLLTLQITSMPIFLVYQNYRRNVCFRILFTNGVTECLELITALIFAILNLLIKDDIDERIQRIGGAVVVPAGALKVLQHVLLALNRLLAILRARFLGSKYIPSEEREALMFNIAHFFCWSIYFAQLASFLSPYAGTTFYRGSSIFGLDRRLPYTETVRNIIYYTGAWLPAFCFAIYVFIVWMAIKSRKTLRRNTFSSMGSASAADEAGKRFLLNDYERRLLIQSILLYALMALLIIWWGVLGKCISSGACSGKPSAASLVIALNIYCGLNPIVFLTMNKEFRRRYLELYAPRKVRGQGLAAAANSIT